ncbi:MAG: GUN4 domain-containing protein [Pseudanabaenaceae cyanobacterium]
MSQSQPTQLLIEYSSQNGYEPHIQGIDISQIQSQISNLTALVQQLAQPPADSGDLQLLLDEVTISIKIDQHGQVVLPANGITLHYRQPYLLPAQPTTTVNVRKLQQLLNDQKWQEANQETWNLLCRAVNKPEGLPLTNADIRQIPCQTLQVIDQLWKQASQGRFGFGIQRRIYQVQSNQG